MTAQPPTPPPRGPLSGDAPSGRVRAWVALIACSLITVVAVGLWYVTDQWFLLGWGLGSLALGVLSLRRL